jgi:hypothetical protein
LFQRQPRRKGIWGGVKGRHTSDVKFSSTDFG